MATQFWLNDVTELINLNNITFFDKSGDKRIVMFLNLLASLSIIIGSVYVFKTKNKVYLSLIILILSITIFIKTSFIKNNFTSVSNFTEVSPEQRPINTNLTNSYNTGSFLVRDFDGNNPSGLNNALYVNQALNFNKGYIIEL
jgi:hypothetical protein